MTEFKHIIEGFVNLILSKGDKGDEITEQRAKERLRICGQCEFRSGLFCGDCGCFLAAKSRSNSSCPKNKW